MIVATESRQDEGMMNTVKLDVAKAPNANP
jgi:hypothetical protein